MCNPVEAADDMDAHEETCSQGRCFRPGASDHIEPAGPLLAIVSALVSVWSGSDPPTGR